MNNLLPVTLVRKLLAAVGRSRITVVGDVMLDHFLWGRVGRISPEAPVPVVEFERESYIPGGAGNVARNLAHLGVPTELLGVCGRDFAASQLRELLARDGVGCSGILPCANRATSIKTRIVAHRQQVVRVDRETKGDLDAKTLASLMVEMEKAIRRSDAVILGDYAKGVITQSLLDQTQKMCRARGVWLSVDPKPSHPLNWSGMSLLTPNRKEAFELAGLPDEDRTANPLKDNGLRLVAARLLASLQPALLLITLGEQGMLLCRRNQPVFHVPTVAREVFDVSGAGDTVIAFFTLAIVGGASPVEAAIFSNHAAGVVVGKFGTATVSREELLASFHRED